MKVFGFAGYSGSGKTTLIEKLVPIFKSRGLKVSLVKHAHHEFDVDQPGKDSYRHRQAGCSEVLVTSSQRWVLMHELRNETELTLQQALKQLSICDLALVEGFKKEAIPKLEIYRASVGKPNLYGEDSNIIGIASDARVDSALPWLDLDQPEEIADFILAYLERNK